MANLTGVIKQLEIQRKSIAGQLSNINAAVSALRGVSGRGAATKSMAATPTRIMSAAARRRIAAAQRARWAKWRATKRKAA